MKKSTITRSLHAVWLLIASLAVPAGTKAQTWTWMGGSSGPSAVQSFGTLGVPASSNNPSARSNPLTWTGNDTTLWLFGGYTSNWPNYGFSNDLWKFNTVSRMWTWVKGSSAFNAYATYGTKGVADPANVPGSRSASMTWQDNDGNLWLFGGQGLLSPSIYTTRLNDMWKYDVSTGMWTWMAGTQFGDQDGSYGTKGVSAPTNVPGSRFLATTWTDAAGNFWLFGGIGSGGPGGGNNVLNDLWKFSPSTLEWTWIGGSTSANQLGVYGTAGVSSPANQPGGRLGAAVWQDSGGDVWIFGGRGNTSGSTFVYLNDLWKYDVSAGEWTWMNGTNSANQTCVYGTMGTEAVTNRPGGRTKALGWTDTEGNFLMFGGDGYATNASSFGCLGDLWKYNVNTNQWTWLSGVSTLNSAGVFGTQGVATATNRPGGRYDGGQWKPGNDYWLFGGSGGSGQMNDVWRLRFVTNAAPAFSGGSAQSLSLCQNSGPYALNTELQTTDTDTAQTLSWTIAAGPVHGTLVGFSAMSQTNGGLVTPSGLSYSPAPGYNGADSFRIQMTDGEAMIAKKFYVNITPLPSVNAGADHSVCAGLPTTLTGAGASSYTWDHSVTDGVSFVPQATATYTVTGTDANGCSNTDAVTITVNPLPAVSAGADLAVCSGVAATLSATGASSYVWDNGVSDGVSFTPASTATYTVTGTDGNGCISSDQVVVTVNPLPAVSAGPDQTLVCPGANVVLSGSGAASYAWNNGVTNNVPFLPSATTTYTVTGTDAKGCTSTDQVTLTLNYPTLTPTGTVNICSGQSVTFTAPAEGIGNYTWKKNGNKLSPKTNICTVASAGNFTVTYTTAGCGTITLAPATVVINAFPPKPTITPSSASICAGATAVFTGPAGYGYQWYDNTTPIPGATTQSYNSAVAGSFKLVTNNNGCVSPSSNVAKVVVNPLPQGSFYVKKVNTNGSLILTAKQTNAAYIWYRNGNPISGATSINYTATQSGIYKLKVTKTTTGCFNFSNDSSVTVNYTGLREALSFPGAEEEEEESAISVYPNPSAGLFLIRSEEPLLATVRDIQGRVVAQKDKAKEIDLSTQPNGIYLLQLFNTKGVLVKSERLTKQ